jgi:hypothetical protein
VRADKCAEDLNGSISQRYDGIVVPHGLAVHYLKMNFQYMRLMVLLLLIAIAILLTLAQITGPPHAETIGAHFPRSRGAGLEALLQRAANQPNRSSANPLDSGSVAE